MKKTVKLLLTVLIVATFFGCDKTPVKQPIEYKPIDELYITTYEAASDLSIERPEALSVLGSEMYLYSSTFPLRSFIDATITIKFVSPESFMMLSQYVEGEKVTSSWYHTKSCKLDATVFSYILPEDPKTFPECEDSMGLAFTVRHVVPSDGEYDFYFLIENPEEDIYYRTDTYHYTVATGADRTLTTSLTIKEKYR